MNASSPRPTADTIVPNLLDAVERLCAAGSPSNVGMRDIADEAGLSIGVAYRYFPSKKALVGAALDRMAGQIAAAFTRTDDLTTAVSLVWQELRSRPAFANIVTWAILDGQDVAAMMSEHPLLQAMTTAASADGAREPQTAAAAIALLGIAGAIHGPTINRAIGRSADDRELYDAIRAMLARWLDENGSQSR